MLENALILIGLTLFAAGIYSVSVILKRPDKPTLLSPSPNMGDESYERDFVCLHLGRKGTIVSSGGVTVRATNTKKANS